MPPATTNHPVVVGGYGVIGVVGITMMGGWVMAAVVGGGSDGWLWWWVGLVVCDG
ncbi:hypothetical protein Tco_0081514, partial [Tanacetum coccineum]